MSVDLVFSPDGECVLVQQVCELGHVQLEELIQLVDLCEVEVDEVISSCLQLGAVQTLGQGGDTYGRQALRPQTAAPAAPSAGGETQVHTDRGQCTW